MQTPRVSLVVSAGATSPLRFDDPEFLDAIARDGDGDARGRLASVLEATSADEVDFTPYIDDGYVLHVRPAVQTGDRLDQFSVAQSRDGSGVDIKKSAARRWADWVLGVEVGEHVDRAGGLSTALANLSSKSRSIREAAYLALPAHVGAAFLGRLDAYRWSLNRPADRDPDKVTALGEALSPFRDTGNNWSGDQSQSAGAGQ